MRRKTENICPAGSNIDENTRKYDDKDPYYKVASSPNEMNIPQEDSLHLHSEDSWGDENIFTRLNSYQKDKNIAKLKNHNLEQYDQSQSRIAENFDQTENYIGKTLPNLHGNKNKKVDTEKPLKIEVEEVVDDRVEKKRDVLGDNKSEVFGRWAFDDDAGMFRL